MKEDYDGEYITKRDLKIIIQKVSNEIADKIVDKLSSKLPIKQFFTVKEFSERTGLDEQTIVNYCRTLSIQATQKGPRGLWMIKATELPRLFREAEAHRLVIPKNTGKRNIKIIKHIDSKKNSHK